MKPEEMYARIRWYRALTIVLTGKKWYQAAVQQYKKLLCRGAK